MGKWLRNWAWLLAVAVLWAFAGDCAENLQKLRVGSYNIRLSIGDRGTPNDWELRKGELRPLSRPKNIKFNR